jgi:hypothetical protein
MRAAWQLYFPRLSVVEFDSQVGHRQAKQGNL